MTCSVVYSTDVKLDARLSINLSIDLSNHRNVYCSRLTMRRKERSLQQTHYLTQKHEVGRFIDRQSDVSRQIIALTAFLQQTHQKKINQLIKEIDSDCVIEANSLVDMNLNRVELNLMTQIILTQLIHEFFEREEKDL